MTAKTGSQCFQASVSVDVATLELLGLSACTRRSWNLILFGGGELDGVE